MTERRREGKGGRSGEERKDMSDKERRGGERGGGERREEERGVELRRG